SWPHSHRATRMVFFCDVQVGCAKGEISWVDSNFVIAVTARRDPRTRWLDREAATSKAYLQPRKGYDTEAEKCPKKQKDRTPSLPRQAATRRPSRRPWSPPKLLHHNQVRR